LQIGKQAYFTGYISNEEVQNKMKEAAIVVVPSIWEEPFGLVVAEAMSNGAAIITTNMGGIPEIVGKNGILIKNINEDKLRKALHSLMLDKKKLENFQNLSWKNFKYTSKLSSVKLDKIRADILDLET
jgi:glycosyltransferase involved in cell wall biosynthesis